jgi:hypothetical protein
VITSHILVLRPSGQPAPVQNCSQQFCRTRTNRLEACHATVTPHSLPFMEHCTGQWHAKIRHGVCTVAKVNLILDRTTPSTQLASYVVKRFPNC